MFISEQNHKFIHDSYNLSQISLLPPPAETAESVNLEHEAIPSKVLSAYDNTQKKLSDISHVSYYVRSIVCSLSVH